MVSALNGCAQTSENSRDKIKASDEEINTIILELMNRELLLRVPNGSQSGYSGRYLNGELSKRISSLTLSEKGQILIHLLGKRNATEFDGEVAYEFKNNFFGENYPQILRAARAQDLKKQFRAPLSPEEISRVEEWLRR